MLPALALLALGAAAQETPRLVASLQKAGAGQVSVRLRNVASHPLVLSARTYLVLLGTTGEGAGEPAYWAELRIPGLPGNAASFRLGSRAASEQRVALASLRWARSRSDMPPQQPLPRLVPPGEYRLQLQLVDEQERWWRSQEIPALVTASGSLELR